MRSVFRCTLLALPLLGGVVAEKPSTQEATTSIYAGAQEAFQDLLNVGGRIFHETHFAPLLHMQGFVSEISLDLVTKSGALLPVLVNSVQKRDAAGRPLLNRTTIFNATDRKRFERELQIAHAFAIRVRRQVHSCLQDMEDNADEEIKGLADHAFDLERFQWDTI